MVRQVQGIIHGTHIELKEDPGLADGVEIEVVLLPRPGADEWDLAMSDKRRTAAGMLAHLPPEVDEQIEAIVRQRKNSSVGDISQ
jgi:hypothetical protein